MPWEDVPLWQQAGLPDPSAVLPAGGGPAPTTPARVPAADPLKGYTADPSKAGFGIYGSDGSIIGRYDDKGNPIAVTFDGKNAQEKRDAATQRQLALDQFNWTRNEADAAREKEEKRQADIKAGRSNIDDVFSKNFGKDYYSGIKSGVVDYYKPQLQQQYGDATRKKVLDLAQRGHGQGSSSANRGLGQLAERRTLALSDIYDQARQAVTDAKGRVATTKSSLYAQNQAAADPSQALTMATSQASGLAAPQSYSPMGQVFADLLNGGATYLATRNTYGGGAAGGAQIYGGGSVRTVR